MKRCKIKLAISWCSRGYYSSSSEKNQFIDKPDLADLKVYQLPLYQDEHIMEFLGKNKQYSQPPSVLIGQEEEKEDEDEDEGEAGRKTSRVDSEWTKRECEIQARL